MDNLKRVQLLQCHESDVNSCDFGNKNRLATASSDHLIRYHSQMTFSLWPPSLSCPCHPSIVLKITLKVPNIDCCTLSFPWLQRRRHLWLVAKALELGFKCKTICWGCQVTAQAPFLCCQWGTVFSTRNNACDWIYRLFHISLTFFDWFCKSSS